MTTLDALRDALVAGGVTRTYKLGTVPDLPEYPYAVVSNAPGAPQVRRLSGSGDPIGRFTVQHFGKTAESVDALAAKTFATFEGKPLALTGSPVAWQEIATAPYRDPDDRAVFDVLHTYRF